MSDDKKIECFVYIVSLCGKIFVLVHGSRHEVAARVSFAAYVFIHPKAVSRFGRVVRLSVVA